MSFRKTVVLGVRKNISLPSRSFAMRIRRWGGCTSRAAISCPSGLNEFRDCDATARGPPERFAEVRRPGIVPERKAAFEREKVRGATVRQVGVATSLTRYYLSLFGNCRQFGVNHTPFTWFLVLISFTMELFLLFYPCRATGLPAVPPAGSSHNCPSAGISFIEFSPDTSVSLIPFSCECPLRQ